MVTGEQIISEKEKELLTKEIMDEVKVIKEIEEEDAINRLYELDLSRRGIIFPSH